MTSPAAQMALTRSAGLRSARAEFCTAPPPMAAIRIVRPSCMRLRNCLGDHAAMRRNMRTTTETRCSCLLTVLITLLACGALADAQTFSVIHSFMGDGDGYQPFAGLLIDQGGNLYGTTTEYLGGSVFQMKPHSAGWTLSTLYQFVDFGQTIPQSRVVKGPGGRFTAHVYRRRFRRLLGIWLRHGVRPASAANRLPDRQLLVVSFLRGIRRHQWLLPRIWRSVLRCRRQYVRHHDRGRRVLSRECRQANSFRWSIGRSPASMISTAATGTLPTAL